MAIRIEGDTAYVDSFVEALEVAETHPELKGVVFSKQADLELAKSLARAFNIPL